MTPFSKQATMCASPLLVLFAFVLPLSTSAGSICAILLILVWLLSGNMSGKFDEIRRNHLAIAVLVYILLHIVGLLWSNNLDWGYQTITKQWKLLLFPLFLTMVKKEHIHYYTTAFVAAIFLKACKAYLVWLGIITLPPSSIFTTLGTTHVTYNPMLALACYIVLQNLLFASHKPVANYLTRLNTPQAGRGTFSGFVSKNSQAIDTTLKIALLLFLSCNMFITAGRTGQIAFFVLLAVAIIQFFHKIDRHA